MVIEMNIEKKDDWDVIRFVGPINEEAEPRLNELLNQVGPKCVINFGQVETINSRGALGWIKFMRKLCLDREVILQECTPEIVTHINMMPSFKGDAHIESVFAFYSCPKCSHQESVLLKEGENLPQTPREEIPGVTCVKCGEEMDMDSTEENFFAFIG